MGPPTTPQRIGSYHESTPSREFLKYNSRCFSPCLPLTMLLIARDIQWIFKIPGLSKGDDGILCMLTGQQNTLRKCDAIPPHVETGWSIMLNPN